MPSQRPRAAFEPISPDLNIGALVEATPNFEYVVKIHCDMIDHQGMEAFEWLIILHVILGGKPLVIEGYQGRLDRWTFALQWLRDNCSQKVENARDLSKKTNLPLSIGHYLNNMGLLTNQWNSKNYKDPDRQRIYLKDIDCPPLWHDKLRNLMPPSLFYLNESTGERGGPGAVEEANPMGPGTRRGPGIAPAGDLMSSLPVEMRAENMMCYIGHEGTYTPSHREMCASLGQNLMVETSTGAVEDGKPTKPGSSIWFMTESKDRHVVSEYWLSALGHDIEVEDHFAQINAWKAAPFKTYVVEQRVGDFILIPPLAPHQVWNRGTRTMKVAWNRTTVETLEQALDEALPRARMVCRDEQYKNKAIVYYTLLKYSKLLTTADGLREEGSDKPPAKVSQLRKDFRRLHAMYTRLLVSESFPPGQEEKKVELIPYDSNITCSYCRCNIFNRFLTCPSCVGDLPNGDQDTYDVCLECYAVGRSCRCISKLTWVEQFPWAELTQKHEQWRRQIIQIEGRITPKSPKALKVEVETTGKRTLAEICQIELKKRPWNDVKKPKAPAEQGDESDDVEVVGESVGRKKKRRPRQSEKFKREHKLCHFHTTWEPKWKQTECTYCGASFCYGTLARAFDMKPQEILADRQWKCPKCDKFCICKKCRGKPGWEMIEPPRTMLGHDTAKVADPRSVESLVDYSHSNISWLQKVGDDGTNDTRRLEKRRQAAEQAKTQEPTFNDHYVEEERSTGQKSDQVDYGILRLAEQEGIPLDPALTSLGAERVTDGGSPGDEEFFNENPEEAGLGDFWPSSSRGPPQPQDVIPAGGVIRDLEDVYEYTEAVTFDYPDPDSGVLASLGDVQQPVRPPVPTGYEPAVAPEEPTVIQMVSNKRKRSGVDQRGEPARAQKIIDKGSRRNSRPQKSLVVTLSVNKGGLAEINKMAVMAQRALRGLQEEEDDTPVIGSDLRALNLGSGMANAQPPAKKVRVEREEEDEDFTGPRVRRGRVRAAPVEHVLPTRRTRTQPIAYEERSDAEEEDGVDNDKGKKEVRHPEADEDERDRRSQSSRSVTVDGDPTDASSPVDGVLSYPGLDEPLAAESTTGPSTVGRSNIDGLGRATPTEHSRDVHTPAANGTVATGQPDHNEANAKARHPPLSPSLGLTDSGSKTTAATAPPTASRRTDKAQANTTATSQVAENRRAKLAAMQWAEGDTDWFQSERWSSSEGEEDNLFIPETRNDLPASSPPEPGPMHSAGRKVPAAN